MTVYNILFLLNNYYIALSKCFICQYLLNIHPFLYILSKIVHSNNIHCSFHLKYPKLTLQTHTKKEDSMTNYTENHLNLFPFQNENLQATFYQPTNTDLKTVLLYFHGGGFVFGSRQDLPVPYLEKLTKNGIAILAVDYPLAPETKLPAILDVTKQITKWFVDDFLPEHEIDNYFIMGRSAGSFLALANGVYTEELTTRPLGIISLYGYFQLNEASFGVPSRHYLQYPKVKDQVIAAQIKEEPLFEADDQNRYLVYLAARQTGDWSQLFLEKPKQKNELSIKREKIKALPPLFLSASTNDPDVPSRQSRQLANLHDQATLHLVDHGEHDFDRSQINTLGLELYNKMMAWMLDLINE